MALAASLNRRSEVLGLRSLFKWPMRVQCQLGKAGNLEGYARPWIDGLDGQPARLLPS
jgi:hypothetical protein